MSHGQQHQSISPTRQSGSAQTQASGRRNNNQTRSAFGQSRRSGRRSARSRPIIQYKEDDGAEPDSEHGLDSDFEPRILLLIQRI